MVEIVEQREYIENLLKLMSSFLTTEDAIINEIELVEANLDLLKERIQKVKETVIKAPYGKDISVVPGL